MITSKLVHSSNKEELVQTVKENPTEYVVGVATEFFPYFELEKANELIGKEFLIQQRHEGRTFRTLFKMEGFTVHHSYLLNYTENNYCQETLNKNGRFLDPRRIMRRDKHGNHIYAYESEKIFKTIETAAEKTQKGVNWIQLLSVYFWDEKRDFGKGDEIGCWEIQPAKKNN
jgi:hypothetical protein